MTSSTNEQATARSMDEAQARKVSDQQLRQRAIRELSPEFQTAFQKTSSGLAMSQESFQAPPLHPIFTFFLERAKRLLLDFVATGSLWRNEQGLPVPKPFRTVQTDWRQFRKRWGWSLGDVSDNDLTDLRDELRFHWEHGNLLDQAARLLIRPHVLARPGTIVWWQFKSRKGQVQSVPPLFDLPRALSYAILDLAPRLGFCANPGCRSPYFLKGRRTQRFCDRPDCVRFAQRQYKKNWWEKRGKEWRASRRRKKSKRNAR